MENSDGSARRPGGQASGEFEWVDAELADLGEPMPDISVADAPPETPYPAASAAARETLCVAAVERLRRRRARQGGAAPAATAWQKWPLSTTLFCVIDLETTGAAHGHDDEILEMGAVQVNGFELGREFVTLVDPGRPISGAAHRVHGIDGGQILASPRLEEALPWLLETTRDRVLVFHNAGFDLGFLQRAMLESGREPMSQPVLDTLVLARRALGGRCALGSLAQRLDLEVERAHRALSDARTTARLLVALLSLCARAGMTTLGEVPALSDAGRTGRARRHPRFDPLLERLQLATRRVESLRVGYHAGAGVAPFELQIRPLGLRGMQLDAYDEFLGRRVLLDVRRIRNVRASL